MKVVINRCYGGFGISEKVKDMLGNSRWYIDNNTMDIVSDNPWAYRADPRLIEAIETVGVKKAGDRFARLKIVDIPDDVEWEIHEYDGMEHVMEKHRTWK